MRGGASGAAESGARPVPVAMLSAFDRLRRKLGEPEALGAAIAGLGYAPVPLAVAAEASAALAALSPDGRLTALVDVDALTGRAAVSLTAEAAAELDVEVLIELLVSAYDLSDAEGEAIEAEAPAAWGVAWAVVFDEVAQLLTLAVLEDGRVRLAAETDAMMRLAAAEALAEAEGAP